MPTFESMTGSGGAGSPLNVSMPATRPDGDLYVFVIVVKGSPEDQLVPDGSWIYQSDGFSGNGIQNQMYVYSKIGASEPASYAINSVGADFIFAYVLRYSGSDLDIREAVGGDNTDIAPASTVMFENAIVLQMYSRYSGGAFTSLGTARVDADTSFTGTDSYNYVGEFEENSPYSSGDFNDSTPSLPVTNTLVIGGTPFSDSRTGNNLLLLFDCCK